jgi:hypothetical protein
MQQYRQVRYDYSKTSKEEIEALLRDFKISLRGAKTGIFTSFMFMFSNGKGEEAAAVYVVEEPKITLLERATDCSHVTMNVLLWTKKQVAHCPCQIGTADGDAVLCLHIAAVLSKLGYGRQQTDEEVARLNTLEELEKREYKRREREKWLLQQVADDMTRQHAILAEENLRFLQFHWREKPQRFGFDVKDKANEMVLPSF